MNIYIITQEDSFVIPKNLCMLNQSKKINILGICVINSSGSLSKKKLLIIRGAKFFNLINFIFKALINKILNFLDIIFNGSLFNKKRSIKAFSLMNKLSYVKLTDVNNTNFLKFLNSKKIDLIVSFSAPSIFKNKLLSIPKYGCINLHCSYLPNYSGILPSFWVLLNDEKKTGVTVHYMDSKIDNGSILAQEEVNINDDDTWFSLIKKTKLRGGKLMLNVIENFFSYKKNIIKNKVIKEKYYSWPSIKDFKKLSHKRKLF